MHVHHVMFTLNEHLGGFRLLGTHTHYCKCCVIWKVWLVFWGPAILFSSDYIILQCHQQGPGVWSSTSFSALVTFVFNDNHPSGFEALAHCGFNVHLPKDGDAEYLMCLLAICVSLFRSLLLFSLGGFYVLSCRSYLHNLDINPLSNMICKCFLPFCELPFHSLYSVLWCTKVLNFDVQFFVMPCACVFICSDLLPNLMSGRLSRFLLRVS